MQLKLAMIPIESRSMTHYSISQLIYVSATTIPHMIEISCAINNLKINFKHNAQLKITKYTHDSEKVGQ